LQALAVLYTWSGLAHDLAQPAQADKPEEKQQTEGSKEWMVENVCKRLVSSE